MATTVLIPIPCIHLFGEQTDLSCPHNGALDRIATNFYEFTIHIP